MKSDTSKSVNFGPRTTKWAYWPRSEFMVKFGCGGEGWKTHRVALTRAGLTPSAVYFKDGGKVAEQFRLKKSEWGDIWRDKKIPTHPYDVKYGVGDIFGDD